MGKSILDEPRKDGESEVVLNIRYFATADTPRVNGAEIARLVGNFLAVQLDAAGVRVEPDSSAISNVVQYEAEKVKQRDPFAGSRETDALN